MTETTTNILILIVGAVLLLGGYFLGSYAGTQPVHALSITFVALAILFFLGGAGVTGASLGRFLFQWIG